MALPDSDSLATYVGAVTLTDYSAIVDPNTDMSAAGMSQALCTTAMGSRTAARAVVVFIDSGSGISVYIHEAVWGNSFAVQPTVTTSGTGHYLITWPTSVVDELAASHAVNLRHVLSSSVSSSSGSIYLANAIVATANTVTVRTVDLNGTLVTPTGQHVMVTVL